MLERIHQEAKKILNDVIAIGLELEEVVHPGLGTAWHRRPAYKAAEEHSHTKLNQYLKSYRIPVFSDFLPEKSYIGNEHYAWVMAPLSNKTSYISNGKPNLVMCMALLVEGIPEFGICHFPHLKKSYLTSEAESFLYTYEGKNVNGNYDEPLHVTTRSVKNPGFSMARNDKDVNKEFNRFASQFQAETGIEKICHTISGEVDAFFVPGINLFDLAAPHAILRYAGGNIITVRGRPINYREKLTLNFACLGSNPDNFDGLNFYFRAP